MYLLVDINVPDSLATFFRDRGHQVDLVRDVLPGTIEDRAIAERADQLSAVVVTWNYRHFKALVIETSRTGRPRYPNIGLIGFDCNEVDGLQRAMAFIDLIEREYENRQKCLDRRITVQVGRTYFRVWR